MFWLNKQVFIGLLSFSESLATECVSLNNQLCLIRRTIIDLNFVELDYCPFMSRLNVMESVMLLTAYLRKCLLSESNKE